MSMCEPGGGVTRGGACDGGKSSEGDDRTNVCFLKSSTETNEDELDGFKI